MRRQTITFALLSAVILIFAGAVISYLNRHYSVLQLEQLVERNNTALARVFANDTLLDFDDYIAAARSLTTDEIKEHPATSYLRDRILRLMKGSSVVKVQLFDPGRRTIFSTDPDQIGTIREDNAGLHRARGGHVASELTWTDRRGATDGHTSERSIVSSYVPVQDPRDPQRLLVMLEIHDDVTAALDQVDRINQEMMAVLWVALLGIYGGLVWMVWRSNVAVARQHEANLKLTAAVARSEAANHAKGEFLANMSHELRTPLNAIIGFSEIMSLEMFGPIAVPAYKDYAKNIHASGTHLLGVVSDILDMAKAEAGSIAVDREQFDLADSLHQAIRMVEGKAQAAGLTLAAEIDPRIPPLVTDERRLRQVVLNLLSNAIKFTPPGGKVTVVARQILDKVAIEIVDTGIGIAEEHLPIALAPFGQVDSSLARKHNGTGLGLPLTKQLVELLDGTFHIDSKVGEGTRAGMTLPAPPREMNPREKRGGGGPPFAAERATGQA
jgi:signal transduction histidine kinase